MNFRKLLTYLTVGTAAVIPFAGAQNPTILQGSYISNVFGQSNFILNPNAQTNVANVTTVTATVTRSTTTPLVATSEFTVAIGTANGTATWATRAFDAGMKGQNCEARFSYRGFAATSKVHIKQGANTVASLNLTPATDPRIASINFPCGDLSTATTFVVTDTAILAGTNEIGGIYVGLATNMANVAQAEFVGAVKWATATNCEWLIGPNITTYGNFAADTDCTTPTSGNIEGQASAPSTKIPGITFSNLKPGRYVFTATGLLQNGGNSGTAGGASYYTYFRFHDGTNAAKNENTIYMTRTTGNDGPGVPIVTGEFEYSAAQSNVTIQLQGKSNSVSPNAGYALIGVQTQPLYISVYRFPTSSELVVTPERQNTFAAGQWTGGISFGRSSTAEITISNAVFSTNRTLFGKAEFTTTANDVAIKVPQMPPGTYRIELTGNFANYLNTAGPLDSICNFFLKDGTNTAVARSQQYGSQFAKDSVSTAAAIVKYTSTADRTFTASLASGTASNTECLVYEPKIIITPLDQPSNSALFVEGPVKASATGAAIPAGYVGEVKHSATSPGCGTVSQYNDGASVALGVGVWRINSQAVLGLTSAASVTNWIVFTSPSTGNVSTWRDSDFNDYSANTITFASLPGIPMTLIVKYDGTNLSFFKNGSFTGSTASVSGNVYVKYFRNGGTCGAVTTSILAERIN